jgi:vitamin B12 transporter
MKKEKRNLYTLMVMLSLSVTGAIAQIDTSSIEIKEIVVTATRSAQEIATTSKSVTVITAEDIEKGAYTSVSEILSQQEGIYIVGNGQNPGMLQSVFTRGASGNHTVIMIDGIRITDPSGVSNALDLSELSLANIAKIEIVRGSHSTLYGSSAIGGAINIITKKNKPDGFHAGIELTGGNFGEGTSDFSENVHMNYSMKSGLYFNASLYNSNVNGLDATLDTTTVPQAFNIRDKDGFSKLDLQGKVGYRAAGWDIWAGYKMQSQTSDIDDGAYNDDDNYTVEFDRSLISYGISREFSKKLSLTANGGFSNVERLAINDSSLIDNNGNTDQNYFEGKYTGTMSTNDLQLNYNGDKLGLVVGGGMYAETMNNKIYTYAGAWNFESETDYDSLDMEASMFYGFAQLELKGGIISDKCNDFSLTLGTRFNSHSEYSSNTTYQIIPSYKVGEGSLIYGSYATGFNAPSLYRLYQPSSHYLSGITRGNPNLNPETSTSLELGLKQKINDKIFFTISVFKTEVNDNVEWVYLWDSNIGIDTLGNDWLRDDSRGDTYINLGTQTNKGIEISVMSKLNDKLSVMANMSIVNGKTEFSPSDIDQVQTGGNHVQIYSSGLFLTEEGELLGLERRSNTANLSLTYQPIKNLSLSMTANYVGPRSDIFYDAALGPYGALNRTDVSEYTLFGLGAHYRVSERIGLNLKVSNLLDQEYSEINGFTTRGRGVYVKFRYSM